MMLPAASPARTGNLIARAFGTAASRLLVQAAAVPLLAVAGSHAGETVALNLDSIEQKIDRGQLSDADSNLLQEFSQKNPRNIRAHVLLGRLYSRYNFGELASAEFRDALKLDRNQVQVWVLLINEKYRHTKIDEAKKVLAEAEQLFPSNPSILLVKGNLLERLKQPMEADKVLARAQAAQPGNPEIYVARAQALCMLRRPQEAVKAADHALALRSRYAAAYLAKARALLMLSEKQRALSALAMGFNFDPFEHGLAALYLRESESQGHPEQALEAALVVMALDVHFDSILPDDKDKVIDLIEKFKNGGGQDKSIQALIEKVFREFRGTGHEAKYLFCLGDIFDILDKPHTALSYYERGLALNPKFARAWLRRGEDLEMFHQDADALRSYRKALALDHNDREIVDRAARMERRMGNKQKH